MMVITVYSLNQFHVWMQLRSFFFLGIGFRNFGLQFLPPILIWFTSVQNEKSCQLTVIVVGMFSSLNIWIWRVSPANILSWYSSDMIVCSNVLVYRLYVFFLTHANYSTCMKLLAWMAFIVCQSHWMLKFKQGIRSICTLKATTQCCGVWQMFFVFTLLPNRDAL